MSRSYKIAMTGLPNLDRKLKAIAEEEGSGKSINKEMRSATREAIKEIVVPAVRANVPIETGFLESELTVKAIRRSRSKMGSAVGFKNDLFTGDTFYAGFHEYGYQLAGGGYVPGDSFLRRPLYQSEARVKSHIIGRLRSWVQARNR